MQPPLPEGRGASGEVPGTDKWCQLLPIEYSGETSLGWWDLKQGEATEADTLLGRGGDLGDYEGKASYENWWPGIRRWRIGLKMENATLEFPEGKHWNGPNL